MQARKICHIRSIICSRICATSTDQLTAEHYTNHGCIEENFLDYAPEEQIVQPDSSFNCISSFLTSTEDCMWFTAILCMGGSAISSHHQLHQQKHFRLGGMAESKWTHCVGAVRDTLVVAYSAPGVNTTHRVASRPLIAASQVLLSLSVSYFKRTLWCCGQL